MTDSNSTLPIRFVVPGQFVDIDLDEDQGERAKRTYESLCNTFTDVTEQQCLYMTLAQEMALARLLREGAAYVATCAARSESTPTRLTTGQFSILIKKQNLNGAGQLADLARGIRSPGEPREVILNSFPAGEAVVIGEELAVRTPMTPSGKQVEAIHRVRQAQVIFPLPDGCRAAILSISTEDVDDWESYVRILNQIAHSVSFSHGTESAIAGKLEAL